MIRFTPEHEEIIRAGFHSGRTDAEIGMEIGRGRKHVQKKRADMGLRHVERPRGWVEPKNPQVWDPVPIDLETLLEYARMVARCEPTEDAVNAFRRVHGLPEWRLAQRWAA